MPSITIFNFGNMSFHVNPITPFNSNTDYKDVVINPPNGNIHVVELLYK